jgi:hypothetical protein
MAIAAMDEERILPSYHPRRYFDRRAALKRCQRSGAKRKLSARSEYFAF